MLSVQPGSHGWFRFHGNTLLYGNKAQNLMNQSLTKWGDNWSLYGKCSIHAEFCISLDAIDKEFRIRTVNVLGKVKIVGDSNFSCENAIF